MSKYIVLLCILQLCLVDIDGTCKINICFTWTISIDRLTLACKVSDIYHSVTIENPRAIEVAECRPNGLEFQCSTHFKDYSIEKIGNKIIVKFDGIIDSGLNGKWRCRHARRLHEAYVDVAVLNDLGRKHNRLNNTIYSTATIIPDDKNNIQRSNDNADQPCLIEYPGAAFIGLIIGKIIIIVIRRWMDCRWPLCPVTQAFCRICRVIVMICLFCISLVFRQMEQSHCKIGFILLLGLLGLAIGVVLDVIVIGRQVRLGDAV